MRSYLIVLILDYGNEEDAGKGIKRAIDEGIVKREDLFITSKLWNSFHEKDKVEPIVRQQLKWWGIECVTISFLHRPLHRACSDMLIPHVHVDISIYS